MKHTIIKVLAYLIGVPLITSLSFIAPVVWDVILFDSILFENKNTNINYLIVFVLFMMIVSVPIIRFILKFLLPQKKEQ